MRGVRYDVYDLVANWPIFWQLTLVICDWLRYRKPGNHSQLRFDLWLVKSYISLRKYFKIDLTKALPSNDNL